MEVKLYLQMLRRSWWIVAITTLATVIAALVVSYLTRPTYQATARFIVSPSPSLVSGGANLLNSLSTLDKRSIVTTYAEILNSQRIYTETTSLLQLNNVDLTAYTYRAVASSGCQHHRVFGHRAGPAGCVYSRQRRWPACG